MSKISVEMARPVSVNSLSAFFPSELTHDD
jgi:hypothetical protein